MWGGGVLVYVCVCVCVPLFVIGDCVVIASYYRTYSEECGNDWRVYANSQAQEL